MYWITNHTQELCTKKNKSLPFLYQMFNVHDFKPGAAYTGLSRILHATVQAFNDRDRLPKYILMMPDWDIIVSLLKDNIESSYVMGATLHYLIKQVDILIARRCQDILEKKPGTVTDGHPYVVWVRMIKRGTAFSSAQRKALKLRGKFNSILEERLLDGHADTHRIMSIDVPIESFDRNGNLTSSGKEDMWKEINRGIRRFDLGEIKLKPR